MNRKDMWETMDGKVFETYDLAEKHEEALAARWMDKTLVNPAAVIAAMDADDQDEYLVTMKDMAEIVFDDYMKHDLGAGE